MNCPKCGNPLIPDMKFCTKCGTPVPQQPPIRQNAPVVQPTQHTAEKPKEFLQYDNPNVKPPQITPQNVVVQQPKKQKNEKKKKSNKNLPLIIVAVVLVLAVLASTIAVVPGIIRNKNEINAATEYIEEFPTLKQKTELLVYDANKFPAEKYEIKVERMLMGGILNGVFKGETIIEEVSTEHVYDIDFKEDGDYRITLTDKTDVADSAETEVIEIVIIIDVKVDNDAEDAVDSVDIHSPDKPAVQYLEAMQEEIDFLTHIFAKMHIQSDTFSPTDPEANKIAGNALTNLFYPVYFDYIEKYGWETPENVMHTEKADPKQIYSKDFIGHTKYPAENMNWLIRNMFNVEPKDTESYYNVDLDDGTTYTGCSWYVDGDYYYTHFDYVDVDPSYSCKIVSREQTDTNKITLTLAVYSFSIYDYPENENGTEVGVFELTAGVKEVDGKRVWSVEEWSKTDKGVAEKEPVTSVTSEETSEITTTAKSESPTDNITQTGDKKIYYDYFYSNYGDDDLVCFADVTHDGKDEMIVGDMTMYQQSLIVFTVKNGQIKRIYETEALSNSRATFFLTAVSGKCNFVEESWAIWSGSGTAGAREFYLTDSGQEVEVKLVEQQFGTVGSDMPEIPYDEAEKKFSEKIEKEYGKGYSDLYYFYNLDGNKRSSKVMPMTPNSAFGR